MNEESIFASALELQPSERAAYLAQACGNDSALRKKVEDLLAANQRVGGFMAQPAVAAVEMSHSPTELLGGQSSPNDETVSRAAQSGSKDSNEEAYGFLSPPQQPNSLGRIGHYEVLQVLGKGGFGIVFRAFDEVLQRVVALKVMAPQLAATSPARKRFLREAQSSAQVRHEHVVQVHEIGETPLPYLVMEFIPGETLQQRLDRIGPVEPAEVVRIGRQIAEGLTAAHATDLIHRDIKPGNILLEGGQQKVKITDFGLARAADDASISQSGIIAGTPMYMAPEQALGQKLDQRADLFSLGSVLYQMVSGRPPFRANGTVAVLKRVAEDTPRPIREIIPEAPQWLCNIIAKLHEKNPDERLQTAREVADVLADCEQQLKLHGALKDFSRIPGGEQASLADRRRKGRRSRQALVATLAAVLLVAAAIWGVRYAFFRPTDQTQITVVTDTSDLEVVLEGTKDGQPVTYPLPRGNSVNYGYEPGRYTLRAYKDGELVFRRVFDLARHQKYEVIINPPGPLASEAGWVKLFNGQHLENWEVFPADGWKIDNGLLVSNGVSSSIGCRKPLFGDGICRLEYKLAGKATASLNVRSQRDKPGAAVWLGIGNKGEKSGSITTWDKQTGTKMIAPANADVHRSDEWQVAEAILRGNEMIVKIDGVETARHTFADIPARGNVGLYANAGVRMYVRKLEIKELPPEEPGWVQLFNRKDLTGWKTHPDQPGEWKVEDGVLVGRGPIDSLLFSERGDFENFHLRVEAKINKGGNSGVFFHSAFGLDFDLQKINGQGKVPLGYEVDMASSQDSGGQRAGSVLRFSPQFTVQTAKPPHIDDDTWFTLEIVVRGKHIVIKINGETATAFEDVGNPYRKGHFALQVHVPTTIVSFRKIEIKELPANSLPPSKVSKDDFALEFDGKTAYVAVPSFRFDSGQPLTVEARVMFKPSSFRPRLDAQAIASAFEPNHAMSLGRKSEDVPEFFARRDLDFKVAGTTGKLNNSVWIHLAGVWDGKDSRLYIDGKQHPIVSLPRTVGAKVTLGLNQPLCFGASNATGKLQWQFLQGTLDEIRLSKIARYEKDFKPPLLGDRFENDQYTMALYHCDEGAGNVLKDSSGNNHHGQIIGATWVKGDGSPIGQTTSITPEPLPPTFKNSIGMEFRLMPAGKFTMGSSPREIDRCIDLDKNWADYVKREGPEHEVEITQPFYLGVTEVTVEQFRQFIKEENYKVGDDRWQKPGFEQTDFHPVVFVTWQNAVDFCTWLSNKEKKTYRLPTEAEWEYCCRANTQTRYSFGDQEKELPRHAWFSQDRTHSVGGLEKNPWGLHDMHGNVWEWCQDLYDPDYYKTGPKQDPQGPSEGAVRMIRGGSYLDHPTFCRSAIRHPNEPDSRHGHVGFRVLLVAPGWTSRSGP